MPDRFRASAGGFPSVRDAYRYLKKYGGRRHEPRTMSMTWSHVGIALHPNPDLSPSILSNLSQAIHFMLVAPTNTGIR